MVKHKVVGKDQLGMIHCSSSASYMHTENVFTVMKTFLTHLETKGCKTSGSLQCWSPVPVWY